MADAGEPTWKVGAVAARSGVTVRALHHYDQLGLVSPATRTSTGHRVYTAEDVARLYRVTVLRRLGLSLAEVGSALDQPEWTLADSVRRHLEATRERLSRTAALLRRLDNLTRALAKRGTASPDDLFAILEETMMLDSDAHRTTSMLVYDDLPAAHEYLVRVFGLTPGPLHRDDQDRPVLGEVSAGDHAIWLHPTGEGYVSPRTVGAVTGMTVVNVSDVDDHHARVAAAGAEIIEEPVDQDYGVREYGVRDLEQHLWFFQSPLA